MIIYVMSKEEWVAQALTHSAKLRTLIRDYHPASVAPQADTKNMLITAPTAELASEVIREQIRQREKLDPLTKFDNALTAKNVDDLMSVLQSAWFGVPESTECWRIPGFKEAVDLLDDPPDPPED